MIPIQSTIIGFSGKPATVFSAYDEVARILVISVETAYKKDRRDGCMLITNDKTIERDAYFDSDKMQESVTAFYALQGGMADDGINTRLSFLAKAQRANPVDSLEKDAIDSRGQKYRVSDDISCVKVAALAACWYAFNRAGFSEQAKSMSDRLLFYPPSQLNQGFIFTI